MFGVHKHPLHSSPTICTGWPDASTVPDCLQLTVTMGTINGLIFNIVHVNRAFFFVKPRTCAQVMKVFQRVLAVFIAMLNLDLGIETCFINGMSMFKRGCSFAFPFYIWMIVGVIIYLSRRSITVVKLVGSSAVSVLATLFLLSYAKLQRTVINAFSFTYLQNYHGDGRSLAVWLFDGNVPFLQGKHIALFLMALSVTVLFILPFTLLLLFAPCIQASNHFLFKRVKMKLLPLLDAYQAPYKDKFRFWTGLMLVVRSILLLGYGLNILGDPDINHLLTIIVLDHLQQTCIKRRLKQWTNCFSLHKYWSCIHYLHLHYLLPHLPLRQV